ncbi:hypothetical protein ACI782_05710 [Geodermatophilus sp. SYSU D00703]
MSGDEGIVVASLATIRYDQLGYSIRHPALDDGSWQECLNTDAAE